MEKIVEEEQHDATVAADQTIMDSRERYVRLVKLCSTIFFHYSIIYSMEKLISHSNFK